MLIRGDESVAQWVRQRMPHVDDFGPCSSIGVVRDGKLIAAAVYNNYCHPNIEISFACDSPRWASGEAIRLMLGMPFYELNCKRITTVTPLANERAVALNLMLGFRKEAVLRDLFDNDHGVICGLLRNTFMKKWDNDGKKSPQST